MDFFLMSTEDSTTLHLPVNPEEVTVAGEKQIETVNILRLGEIDFPTGDRRAEVRFGSFFPAHYDPGYCRYADLPTPDEALQQLLAFRDNGRPVRFLVTDSPINTLVLVVSVSYRLKGGEPGDIYYDVVLRTYREAKAAKQTTPSGSSGLGAGTGPAQNSRPDTKPTPKIYTVKPGDSLWTIAKAVLGSGERWKDLYEANKAEIGPDPNALKIGMKLVMP